MYWRILIVDDDADSVDILYRALVGAGCDTQIVCEPEAVIETLATEKFNLIFLDWNLEGLNGREALMQASQRLPLTADTTPTPVIIYSSQDYIENIDMNHFMVLDHWRKPLSFFQLAKRIKDISKQLETEKYVLHGMSSA